MFSDVQIGRTLDRSLQVFSEKWLAAKIAVGNAANLPSSLPTVEGASRLGRAEVEKEAERQELGASRPSGCAARAAPLDRANFTGLVLGGIEAKFCK